MWIEGASAEKIGRAIGYTRNAVIGRLRRMGCKRDPTVRKSYPPVTRRAMRERKAVIAAIAAVLPVALAPLTPHMTIQSAAPYTCRYINDSGCDAPICGRYAGAGSWCGAHRRVVYAPAKRGAGDIARFAAWRDGMGQFRRPGDAL